MTTERRSKRLEADSESADRGRWTPHENRLGAELPLIRGPNAVKSELPPGQQLTALHFQLKCLSYAKEEGAQLFSRAAVDLESVIESQHYEGVANAKTEAAGCAEIREPKVTDPGVHVADVDETNSVEDPKERVA